MRAPPRGRRWGSSRNTQAAAHNPALHHPLPHPIAGVSGDPETTAEIRADERPLAHSARAPRSFIPEHPQNILLGFPVLKNTPENAPQDAGPGDDPGPEPPPNFRRTSSAVNPRSRPACAARSGREPVQRGCAAIQRVGQQTDKSFVGRRIHRRSRHLDPQLASQRLADFIRRRPRLKFHRQQNPVALVPHIILNQAWPINSPRSDDATKERAVQRLQPTRADSLRRAKRVGGESPHCVFAPLR